MAPVEPSGEVEFETARIVARRWVATDLKPLLAVYGDAQAMRWVGDGQPLSEAQAIKWLKVTADNYRIRGYGMFAVALRDSGSVIGFCGLVHPGGQAEAEVKYAFSRAYWGLGYATEVVSALLSYGAREHGLREIIATVAPENAASHRVLAKARMARNGIRTNEDASQTTLYAWHPDRGHEL